MRTQVLIAFAALTALTVGGAAAALHQRAPSRLSSAVGEPVFPAVLGKPGAVSGIVITHGDSGVTLARKGDAWVLPDRADYPVRADDAKRAVDVLANMRLMEQKTARGALLPRLDLDEPKAAGAKATLVTLKAADGTDIGSIVLGKARSDSLDDQVPGIYVRRPTEQQAWLAVGDPRIRPAVADWLDRSVLDVKTERIREAATVAGDGRRLVVSRDKAADKDFKIYNQPEGTKIKSQYTINDLASAVDPLSMEDVKGATAIAFPTGGANQAEFRTFDGLLLRLTLAEDKGATWLRAEALTEPWRKTEGDQTTVIDPTDAVKKEAEEINGRVRNYVFRVSDALAKKLTSRLADLTDKEEKKDEPKKPSP